MAQGQGQVSIGGGIAQAGALTSQMGQSFLSAGPGIFNAGMNINQLMGGLPNLTFMFGGGSPRGYGRNGYLPEYNPDRFSKCSSK